MFDGLSRNTCYRCEVKVTGKLKLNGSPGQNNYYFLSIPCKMLLACLINNLFEDLFIHWVNLLLNSSSGCLNM